MGDHTSHQWDRRTFLKATGAAGSAAALGGVSTAAADDGSDDGDWTYVIYSDVADLDDILSDLPEDARPEWANPQINAFAYSTPDSVGVYQEMSIESQVMENPHAQGSEPGQEYEALEFEVDFGDVEFDTSNDPRLDGQYAPQQTRATEAWDTTLGSDDVVIGIVDQGVQYDHPDLEARFGSNKGQNFAGRGDDPYPQDLNQEIHGTHVAGIAAATTDNGEGVAGQSNSTLLSARALGTGGSGGLNSIADAVEYCASNGADIINMSLGGGGFRQTLKNAMSFAVNNGALPLASAGNSGRRGVSYPAAYEEVVCVSAVNEAEDLASFSQYGPKVDVTGPGVDVLSTWPAPGQPYNRISGTSMSCPAASGVAALGLAADPGLGVEELRQRLKTTAADIGLSEEEQGAGRVDALNIVNAGGTPGDPDFGITDLNAPASATVGDVITVTADVANTGDGDGTATVDFRVDTSGNGSLDEDETLASKNETIAAGGSATVSFDVDTSALAAGTFTHGVVVGDDVATAEITLEEGGGDPPENQPPVARFEASATTVEAGEEVTFDATSSSDPDGKVDSFRWNFGDGTRATGPEVTHTYEEAGSYTVSLGVVDNDGAGDTAEQTITVESGGGGGQCGAVSETASVQDSLRGYYDDDAYTYTVETDNPCQITVGLVGARGTDFDLYVTADGREPSIRDFDKRSISPDSEEVVRLEEFGDEVGILVDSWAGRGAYELAVEELGR